MNAACLALVAPGSRQVAAVAAPTTLSTRRRRAGAGLVMLVMSLLLGACAGAPASRVTLMPDADGKVGRVTVSTTSDKQNLEQAYAQVAVSQDGRLSASQADPAAFAAANAQLLQVLPAPPYSAILYFVAGTSELTRASAELLPEVAARIRERSPTAISVIGHTDSTGSDEANVRLGLERAREVDRLLHREMKDLAPTTVKSFGSRDPLVPTGPQVDEPRNRRVEINVL
jgi:outer membrane protein OmpA-like peptidoglycan-associated protein